MVLCKSLPPQSASNKLDSSFLKGGLEQQDDFYSTLHFSLKDDCPEVRFNAPALESRRYSSGEKRQRTKSKIREDAGSCRSIRPDPAKLL
ncbi:hypothetical protein CHARACLAT_022719 [Characodon lateralis]|uniref:Uncharacterized protein n=1 Tax=Characodon lateralis TaxID=208331 RepID=A0ABU7EWF7_9TELE|nr:hypothetical protein [Characodon lateralis]